MQRILLPLIGILFILNGCASMHAADDAKKRSELDAMAETVIAHLLIQYPDLQSEIDAAQGYMVARMTTPADSGGEGVLVVNKPNERRYFTIGGLELSSGWGSRSFKILLILQTQEMLDRFKDSRPIDQQAAVTADESATLNNDEYIVYVLSDSGVAVTSSVKIIDYRLKKP